MNIIVCADMNMGTSFNGKRPTRDRNIICHILTTHSNELYIFPNSEKYVNSIIEAYNLKDIHLRIIEEESDIWQLPCYATLFIETGTNEFFETLMDNADTIELYQWQTTYLYTEQFPDILRSSQFVETTRETLKGTAHDEVLHITFDRKIEEPELPTEYDSRFIEEHDTPSLPFLDYEHKELYNSELDRLSTMQYNQTGRKLPPEMFAPMFLMTGMPFVYHRLKDYIPSQENPYPNYIDFPMMRENLRLSRGETLMLDLAENLFNGRQAVNLCDIIAYCDSTMCRLAKRTIDMAFAKRLD